MSSTVQLRRLSQELVRLRKEAGLTVEEVTKAMDWSTGRLTYMEKAKWVRADIGNVTRLLELYGVDAERREALLDLARQSKARRGWWVAYRDIFAGTSLPGFEDASSMIRTFESVLIPGLLQTEDYARAVLRGGLGHVEPSDLDRRIEARRARQQILRRNRPPEFWAVIDEAALLRMVGGPEVMASQLQHLIERAAWPRITIQLLPLSVGAHAAMTGGAFVIMDFPSAEDRPLVYLEEAASSLFLEEASDVQAYTLVFSRITTSALSPDETVRHLAMLRDQLHN